MQPFVKWAEKIGDMKKMLLKNKLGFKIFLTFWRVIFEILLILVTWQITF